MTRRFVVAHNPDGASSLPFLLRIPLPDGDLVLKAREPWPQANKVYCHRASAWPEDAELVEDVAVKRCVRRGRAIDLVFTSIAGGREAIFWQTASSARAARPGVRMPTNRTTRAHDLSIVVDTRERYPFRFTKQRAATTRRALSAGDYAVERDGLIVAVVERKTLGQLASDLVDGGLGFQLAELAAAPAAAVVVEDRYSALFKLEHVRAGWVPELLAQAQARYPHVPIVFCETRALAEEWTYRYLAASAAGDRSEQRVEELTLAPPEPDEPVDVGFDRAALADAGFVGWVAFDDLPDVDVPRVPGVYVVVRPDPTAPRRFRELSPAGWFKDRDPTVGVGELERRWVIGASTLYVGKAKSLRARLDQYRRHGAGEPVGHWGGRYVWQLDDAGDLLVAWQTVDGDPAVVETELLAAFERRYGALPFANLTRGRARP